MTLISCCRHGQRRGRNHSSAFECREVQPAVASSTWLTRSRPARNAGRVVGWTIAAIAIAAVIAVLVLIAYMATALVPDKEPPVEPRHTTGLEDQLRSKGPAEDALPRYEAAVQGTADDLNELVPGLTWRWNREAKYVDCTGDFADTRGIRIITGNLVSDGPIPDQTWPEALQTVRNHAAELGASQQHVYADKPGHHDIAFYGGNGIELAVIASGQVVLTATTDCYLQRGDM